MRRILIVGLLFLLMYGLEFLQVGTDAPINPKSLATLGFILMAAYTLGEITGSVGFPRITGHILTGILFGPHVINLFSLGVVEDLTLINSLAIGLIALTAGGEMKLEGLRIVARGITLLVLVKGFIILAIVTMAVVVAAPLLPFLDSGNIPLLLAVGFIFGVLAMGTSPAATIAVINETGSRGRLTDLALGTAVAKDVVMVVLLALGISLARLFSTPGATFSPEVLATVGKEILMSIIAGAIVGGIIIAYIRFIHAEMWFFIIGVIFLASTAAQQLHLEALLMFITAGFVVQNLSQYGDEFIRPIENVSLPVYVVFFSIAGAGLDLASLRNMWAIAIVLVTARLAALYGGARLATVLAGEPAEIRLNAWMSFISQAGVVLGLSIMVAENLPGFGAEIKAVVLATIGINLLIGPVTFKIALARCGETRGRRGDQGALVSEPDAMPAAAQSSETVPHAADIGLNMPDFSSRQLNLCALELRDQLGALKAEFEELYIDGQAQEMNAFIQGICERYETLLDGLEDDLEKGGPPNRKQLIGALRTRRVEFSSWLLDAVIGVSAGDERMRRGQKAFHRFLQQTDQIAARIVAAIEVDQERARLFPVSGDSLYVRSGKTLKRMLNGARILATGTGMKRIIPVRKLARYHLAGRLPGKILPVAGLSGSMTLFALRKVRLLYSQADDNFEAAITWAEERQEDHADEFKRISAIEKMRMEFREESSELVRDIGRYRVDLVRHLTQALTDCYNTFLVHLHTAGTFELPYSKFRYSKLRKASEKARGDIDRVFELWRKYETGYAGTHAKHIEVVMLMDRVSQVVDETLFSVLESMDDRIVTNVQAALEYCRTGRRMLTEVFESMPAGGKIRDRLALQQREIIGSLEAEILPELHHLRESRELNTLIDVMLQRFSDLADMAPEEYLVLEAKDFVLAEREGMIPPEVKLKRAPMRQVARSYLEREIARRLADVNRMMLEQVDETISSVTEVYQFLSFNLRTAMEQLESAGEAELLPDQLERPKELAFGAIDRAVARLSTDLDKIRELEEQVYSQIIAHVDDRMRDLEELILERSMLDIKVRLQKEAAIDRGFLYLKRVRRQLAARIRRLMHRYRPIGREVVKDLRSTLGLIEYTPAEIVALYEAAKVDGAEVSRLPFIYQKLFESTPLESGDFLVAREDELKVAELARERWQQGNNGSLAVIGELGSGKTSFINAMLNSLFNKEKICKRTFVSTIETESALAGELSDLLGMRRCSSLEQVQAMLIQIPGRVAIVLEDAHKLFLRVHGGFEGLRKLWPVIAATSHKVLWVVSMPHFSWTYLDKVTSVSDAFTFVINMEDVSREEVENMILRRHRVSGFDLKFLPGALIRERKKYRRARSEEEKQKILRKEYFDQLSRASGGNILAAIFYWLRSHGGVEDNRLIVNPVKRIDFHFLHQMPVDKLLTLAMIIQHGSLTAAEHARIFRTGERASLSLLLHLANLNLVEQRPMKDHEPRFCISRAVYKPLADELKERNILSRE